MKEFGQPAADQNWGFGSFNMIEVTEPAGSPVPTEGYEIGDTGNLPDRRAMVLSVQKDYHPTVYKTKEDLFAQEADTAYFYLRIDNTIVLQELGGVVHNKEDKYYPGDRTLENGANDYCYNLDNRGSIYVEEWKKLGLIEKNGITYATDDQPIPSSIFKNESSFETMALHVPDSKKIELAGSVEAFNSDNFKIMWYVCKWQGNANIKSIHVDGILVPKNQITVNVPEYKKRIIVEDLKGNINATTQVNGSDFEFNDVVFDAVTWNRGGKNHQKILVRAAGGRMPIYVAGKEVHEGIGYMFNTENPDYTFSKVLIADSIIGSAADQFDFNSIPVEVEVSGERTSAGSNVGEAPEKIAVGLDYQWCKEKQNIKEFYPRFVESVGDKSVSSWWK